MKQISEELIAEIKRLLLNRNNHNKIKEILDSLKEITNEKPKA
jgi:hypothetical protein